jgi:hypothetical protein
MSIVTILDVTATCVADSRFSIVMATSCRYTVYDVAPVEGVHESHILVSVVGEVTSIVNTGASGICKTMMKGEFEGAELPAAFIATIA